MGTRTGLTLIEVLLALAIVVIVAGLFIGILGTSVTVQLRESSRAEVANQANFVMQTIQRLVRESSAAIVNCDPDPNFPEPRDTETFPYDPQNPNPSLCPSETMYETYPSENPTEYRLKGPQPVLRLRMPDADELEPDDRDPIEIWAEDGAIKIREKNGTTRNLTTDRVTCESTLPNNWNAGTHCLTFTKFTNHPGRDHIEINLTLTSTQNPSVARQLITSVSRASAATFDSDVFPGSTNKSLGTDTNPWEELHVKKIIGGLSGGGFEQPENYEGNQRGYLIAGYYRDSANTLPSATCQNICTAHGLTCWVGEQFFPSVTPILCTDAPDPSAGFCLCKQIP